MKKTIIVLTLIFVFCYPGQAGRVITSFDIARWYLNSDLVLICNVKQIDTIRISHHDTLLAGEIHLSYDIIKEKYQICLDSIIKGGQIGSKSMMTIFTPDFIINYSKSVVLERKFTGIDSKGDSTFLSTAEYFDDVGYDDYGYFRLKPNLQRLVILRKVANGYVIDYASDCGKMTLDLIRDIKNKGENYFTPLFINDQKNAKP